MSRAEAGRWRAMRVLRKENGTGVDDLRYEEVALWCLVLHYHSGVWRTAGSPGERDMRQLVASCG